MIYFSPGFSQETHGVRGKVVVLADHISIKRERIMNRTATWVTVTLSCLLAVPAWGQTTPPTTGKTCPAGDAAGSITDQLMTGGLAGVLQNGDLARALGLNEDQYFEAQAIIDAYQSLMQVWTVLDPVMQNPESMQAIMMIRFMLDWELYTLLTDEQQAMLEKLFSEHQNTGGQTSGSTSASGTSTVKK